MYSLYHTLRPFSRWELRLGLIAAMQYLSEFVIFNAYHSLAGRSLPVYSGIEAMAWLAICVDQMTATRLLL